MSLFLEERIDEQKKKEDPLEDKITFTRPWIIEILPPDDNDNQTIYFEEEFGTCYKFGNEKWFMKLSTDDYFINFTLNQPEFLPEFWDERIFCFASYNLFYDNDMRFLLYSSTKIRMEKNINKNIFQTPDGFMTKLKEAFYERKIARIVIFVEIQIPTKNFYYQFEKTGCTNLNNYLYEDYPEDIDNDRRFEFLKDGDFVIKCSDESILARQKCLNLASKFFKKNFNTSNMLELVVVEHSIDVVKPIIIYFHTRCFTMPKVYDFNYAKRLLNAVDFFEPEYESVIKQMIQHFLCKKIVTDYQDFDAILQWTSLATRHSLVWLEILLATVIADKFYFKWQQTFPENDRNIENPLFLSIFGSERSEIFDRIDGIFKKSFLTNIILD